MNRQVLPILKQYMNEDVHGESTICNIYFDTKQYDLIRHSITKPFFKEKVRLRSYNTPTQNSKVYLEIKRKYDKVVGKRRIETTLEEIQKYKENISSLQNVNEQIQKELDYTFKFNSLEPTMYISYLRTAYYEKENMDFRATIDKNVLARNYDLHLESGSYGTPILNKNYYILEIKTLGSIPLWFVRTINELNIKPGNFSKYGEAYEQIIMEKKEERITQYIFEELQIQNSMEYAI